MLSKEVKYDLPTPVKMVDILKPASLRVMRLAKAGKA